LFGTTCLVGCALFGLTTFRNAESESEAAPASPSSSAWGEWKNSVMTNYESRIRDFSSPEKVFSVFASVSKDGHNYMTVDDFIRALIPHEHSALHPRPGTGSGRRQRASKHLPAAFQIADQDQDGLISFEEYLFFVTLLSIPEQSFKVAFRMLDVNDDGQVDQNEFMKLISFLRVASPHVQQTRSQSSGIAQGWLTHYFGAEHASKLTLEAFSKFLQQLKSDVLRLEFNLYDPQELGYISQRDFGMLILSYARSKNLQGYMNRASKLEPTPLKLFTFEQFQNFNMLLEHLPEVETAMQLYQLNGRPFKKQDLSHLSKIVCGTNLNQQVIDTIMNIFDTNNDGTLDLDEFVTVLKRRKGRGLSEPRDTGFFHKVEKIMKCVREA
jgi:Ca2+-binding EF-hand superfamily protein